MKKLMIAAAAAAMIGGAYAELAYDYTANLKTTDGKKSGKVNNSFDLGWDGIDTFWYADAQVVQLILADQNGEYFKMKTVGGNQVPGLTDKAKKNAVWLLQTLDIARLAIQYPFKSDGKWCEQVKFQTERCYRATKSIKQKAVVYVDDCCTEDFVGEFTNKENADTDCVITFDLNHRFGGGELSKATKVEVFGFVNAPADAGTAGSYSLAGQGNWKANLFGDVAGIKDISGNIVGVLDAPTCFYCCQNPDSAYAWECDADSDADLDANLYTAAFGTWTLKFNRSKSN